VILHLNASSKRKLLAQGLGFSSSPEEEYGNVWCWGAAKGNFQIGVNLYVYEVYYVKQVSLFVGN
jgi:hypothetical protein